MLCKSHLIVLYTVHFTAFCLGGRFFPDTVYMYVGLDESSAKNIKNCVGLFLLGLLIPGK